MKKSELLSLVNECVQECLNETLVLKRYQDQLVAVSNAESRKDQSNETFKNKDKLKKGGFRWDSALNSWKIDISQFEEAKKVLAAINKLEQFEERIEELPEFLLDTDNLSKKDELSQRIDGFLAMLNSEVDAVRASEEIKNFMNFQAKLKSRSFHNTLLIYLQNKTATHVEGFRVWQNKFGRQVRKGAKGITIIVPLIQKEKTNNPVAAAADATTGDDGEVDNAVKTQNTIRFGTGTVFDIKDTDPIPGKEHLMPEVPKWHADDTPNEAADKLVKYTTQMATEMGIKITGDASRRGEMGYSAGDHINITSEIAGVNKAGTLIHEIAHELLHQKTSVMGSEEQLSKVDKEIQAESVSYLVLKHYDLPAKHHATYLTLWKANKDNLHKNLSAIKKAVDFIIDKIDKIAAEDSENAPKTSGSVKEIAFVGRLPKISFMGKTFEIPVEELTHHSILRNIAQEFGISSANLKQFVAKNANQMIKLDAGGKDKNEFSLAELMEWVQVSAK